MKAIALILMAMVSMTEDRAYELAAHFSEAAHVSRVPVSLIIATSRHESSFKAKALSDAGARGLMQLHPINPYFVPWQQDCKLSPESCEALNVRYGAMYLRDAINRCGSTIKALGMYRTGRCVEGPKGLATWRLHRAILWRLKRKTNAPFHDVYFPR